MVGKTRLQDTDARTRRVGDGRAEGECYSMQHSGNARPLITNIILLSTIQVIILLTDLKIYNEK